MIQRPAHGANYSQGRSGKRVEYIVAHVSQSSMSGMAAWFANPAAGVSAHYGISEDGEVVQYVDEGNTAHHAGNWDINQRSIGIEHAGIGEHYVPTEPQLVASARLAVDVCVRYGITPNGLTIRPHRDFRATRCPANFPMDMYVGILQGLMLCGDTRA